MEFSVNEMKSIQSLYVDCENKKKFLIKRYPNIKKKINELILKTINGEIAAPKKYTK